MSDRFQYLHQSHIEGQTKYIYFLLAAAASGIGLAVNMTIDAQLSWSQVPLAFALLLWGTSFFLGAKAVMQRNSMIGMNALAVEISKTGKMSQRLSNNFNKEIKDLQEKELKYRKNQFRLLIFGALLFVIWHVVEMYCRTMTPTSQEAETAIFLQRWMTNVCR